MELPDSPPDSSPAVPAWLGWFGTGRRLYALLFVIGLVVYGLVAGNRLWRQSEAPHFVYQADAWLHGVAEVAPPLPNDDWAQVETVTLDDGSVVQGRRMLTQQKFQLLGGGDVDSVHIRRSLGFTAYVSFPALPSVIMLPGALLWGRTANDVIPTLLVAALILPLTLLMLRRLAVAGLSKRSIADDLWLVATLAFGSVLFFSSVQGKVWYTAHVVGVALSLVYLWASIEAKRPIAAGLALGAAALTRTAMAFMFPLFLLELWRVAKGDRKQLVRTLARFAVPVLGFAILGMLYNQLRFHSPTEFGHKYLALGNHQPVRQQLQIEHWGLASLHYLPRNLAVAFGQVPQLSPFKISGHGLAMWVTTPLLFLLVLPRDRGPMHWALWITVALVAAPSLLYMNSGWFQFGYRFSLDYFVFLIALLAIGGRPLGRVAKALILFGIALNLFGAITFERQPRFYDYNSYDHIKVLGVTSVDN